MNVFLNVIFLLVGLFLVVKGGDYFVTSAVSLAKKTKIPEVIIGATIVSLATTLPELIVSVVASANGQFDMAVGNGVGTMISNIAFICGVSIFFIPMKVKKSSNVKYFILLFCALFVIISSLNNSLDLYESIILLVVFAFFMTVNVIEAIKEMKKYPQEKDEDFIESKQQVMPWKKIIPLFLIGALAIAFGAMTLVDTASNLAKIIGVSDEIVGLTVVALGTSLPELTTAIISVKKQSDIGYGNIIGANIINNTLLLGLSGAIAGKKGLPITKESLFINIPILFVVTLIFILPLIFKSKTYKWQGLTLLILYSAYIVYLILTALGVVVV